jgi:hypothetical protein
LFVIAQLIKKYRPLSNNIRFITVVVTNKKVKISHHTPSRRLGKGGEKVHLLDLGTGWG